MRVAWFTFESLSATIGRAKVDASVHKVVDRICRADFIVIDDIGLLPTGQEAAEAFYRVIDAAYEKRSVALTSNLHPSGFDTIMPKTLATAAVDRFLHHAHMVSTDGALHPSRGSPRRKGGQAHGLRLLAGEVSWPPVGRTCCPLTLRYLKACEADRQATL